MQGSKQIPQSWPGQQTGRHRGWGRFALHYLEMVVAMFAGMLALGGTLRVALAVAGVDYGMDTHPELTMLEMGFTMALGMTAWMRYRRHGWSRTLEMSGTMVAPAVAAVPLVAWDVMDAGAVMAIEHVAMFALMFVVMLLRRGDYLGHAHGDSGVSPQ